MNEEAGSRLNGNNEREGKEGQNNIQPNKPLIKRFWWVFAVLFFLVIGGVVAGFTINAQNEKKAQDQEAQKQKERWEQEQNQAFKYIDPIMSDAQLQKASAALQSGISIDDPANDFAAVPPAPKGLDGKNDNTKPYKLDWNDIKKVSMGADKENVYVRYDFYGAIPDRMVTVEGDDIKTLSCNIVLSNFTTTDGGTNEGMWQVGISFTEQRGKDSKDESLGYDVITPRIGLTSIASPSKEQDKYGETIYSKSSVNGTISGGTGKDYIIAAFPLANLDVLPESQITFDISVETNSRVYHHSSIDPLLDFGSEKSGQHITWKIGSNAYTSKIPKY